MSATQSTIPVPVLMGTNVLVVYVPQMSEAAFAFMKHQLSLFQPAIVLSPAGLPQPEYHI